VHSAGGWVRVRPAASKNEEADEAREQQPEDRARRARYEIELGDLHGHYYYAFAPPVSTSPDGPARAPTA
jgi:hypothetical protein